MVLSGAFIANRSTIYDFLLATVPELGTQIILYFLDVVDFDLLGSSFLDLDTWVFDYFDLLFAFNPLDFSGFNQVCKCCGLDPLLVLAISSWIVD